MAELQNRIVEHGDADPKELEAHPLNWREHPEFQQAALLDVLERVGWVQDIIVNKRTNKVIDGHLRREIALHRGESAVPVKYVDLSEEEEAVVLATLDPLSALASPNTDTLEALLKGVDADGALGDLLAGVKAASGLDGLFPDGVGPQEKDESIEGEVEFIQCPSCSHRWPK